MIVIKRRICYTHRAQEEGACHTTEATQGSTRVAQEGERVSEGKCGQESLYYGFHEKERVRQDKQI